jgi:hypothetical protein
MPVTSRWAIPYPAVSDPPNMPAQSQSLAVSVDSMAKDQQGLLADRPVSSPSTVGKFGRFYFATDEGVLYRDFGVGWRPAYIAEMGIGMPGVAPTDYSMFRLLIPASPATGQYDVVWTFRYRSAEATYKWMCVEGPPIIFWSGNGEFEATATSSGFAALNISGSDLQINLPRAGIYEFEYGGNMWNASADCGEHMSYRTPAAEDDTTMLNWSIGSWMHANLNADPFDTSLFQHHHARRIRRQTIPTAGNIKLMGRQVQGGTAHFRGVYLSARPVKVA